MTGEQIALALLEVAIKCWPLLRDVLAHSSHPEAQRVRDILPDPGESAKAAADLGRADTMPPPVRP